MNDTLLLPLATSSHQHVEEELLSVGVVFLLEAGRRLVVVRELIYMYTEA